MHLWSAAVKRSRADWPVVLAAWTLLAAALGLLAAGALYTQAVSLAGLHREVLAAPAADRAIVARTRIRADRFGPADEAVTPVLEAAIASTGGEVAGVARSTSYADAATPADAVRDLVIFGAYEGIERHATLTAGAWGRAGADRLEVTLPAAAARVLGVELGDPVDLVARSGGERVRAVVTGTWTADPADPYWLGDPLVTAGEVENAGFRTVGPLVVAPEDLSAGRVGAMVDAEWRAIPAIDGLTTGNLDALAGGAAAAAGRVNASLPPSNRAQVSTRLPAILASVDRSLLVAQSGILLLVIQFAVLGGYAVILVAALLADRRRTETALLRARGAGSGHLLRLALAESLLITVPAVLVAPWLGAAMVGIVRMDPLLAGVGLGIPLPDPGVLAISAAGGLVAVIVLVLPTIAGGVPIASVRAAVGRQVGRTLPQRLGLDLVLVLLAALAMLQLRLYGAPLTRNTRGVLGVDPLLVAAPAIGLVAGAIIAVRAVPRVAELAERVLARDRRLVPSLAGRQLARRPLRYTRAALLLILAAALGTFASAHAATWERSQVDQAAFATGSDLRVTPGSGSQVPEWAYGAALRGIDGVDRTTPVTRLRVSLGSALRDAPAIALDAQGMRGVVRVRDGASAASTDTALARLAAARAAGAGLALPGDVARVSVVVTPHLRPVEGFDPIPDGYRGLSGGITVMDGDGKVHRIDSGLGPLGPGTTRLEIPLVDPQTGASLMGPVMVLALDVALDTTVAGYAGTAPRIAGEGTLDTAFEIARGSGGPWTPLETAGSPLTAWTVDAGAVRPFTPSGPGVLDMRGEEVFGAAWRVSVPLPERATVPALASAAFLDRTVTSVGDTVGATMFGVPVDIRIVDRIDGFPTVSPDDPYLLVDGAAVDLARVGAGVSLAPAGEWWTATRADATQAVARAVEAAPLAAQSVVSRAGTEAGLAGDPMGLSVIGILGLGSLAALLFAAVGFLVSATVSTQERLGELALLKALGVAPRQMLGWLTAENGVMLVGGLAAGVALGLVLAWLALPFATLTASGEPPVPAPVVVVPPQGLVPIAVLAATLLAATAVLVRRLLTGASTSAVLRARDE